MSLPLDDALLIERNLLPRDHMNVLAVTARPHRGQDIPLRLITRSICRVVERVSMPNLQTPTLDIARPVTMDSIKA